MNLWFTCIIEIWINLNFFTLALPTPELVASVRNIYLKRVGDVRFLIPVLNGLSKSDILAALPKLIKLNPIVVKEVSMVLTVLNIFDIII